MKTTLKSIIHLFLIFIAAVLVSTNCVGQTTATFNCSGAATNWTVPPCVTSINVVVAGGDGGGGLGGNGAVLTATIPVVPGQVIGLNVGCSGNNLGGAASGGFGGGGVGFASTDGTVSYNSSGGGGASTITIGGSPYMIAAGGGGEGGGSGIVGGGVGGCVTGGTGTSTFGGGATPGTQTAGGTGGAPWAGTPPGGSNGGLGFGGAGGFWQTASGGGGGGGYYGGGGGGNDGCCTGANGGGGGGGGSSLVPGGAGCTSGSNNGPGYISITYTSGALAPTVNSPTICAGSSATLTATGGTTYLWNTGSTANPLTVSPAVTTSYTVTATTGACTGTAVSTVTVKPLPTVTPEPNLTYCAGVAVPANTFASTPAGATFTWTNSNAAIGLAASGITSLPAFTATNGTGAPITSTITITPTLTGCTGPSSIFTITINPLPITTVNSPTICPGGTATLTAAGAATYSWSTGAVTNPINVTPAVTTSYTVTGTSLTCTSTAVATVTVGAAIMPTVNSPTICAGATATLTATGGTTYLWNTGSAANPLSVTPAATTSYTVTATTGTCTGTAVSTVTVNPLPVTTVNSPTICDGITAGLTAGGAASYTWTAGTTSTGVNTVDVTPSVTTTYTVTGTSLGCTSTAVSTVTVNPIPVTTVNSPSICPASTATLTAGGATTYLWNTGSIANPLSVTPAATTSYTVTGTSLGCSSTAVSTVTVTPGLTPNAGLDDSVCFAGSIVLNVTPNGAGYGYVWTPAATLVGAGTFNPTASPTATTNYSVTVTDPSGCTGTDNVTIYADPQITMAIAGINVTCNGACNGQTIVIPGGGTPAYSYLWSSGCTGAACTALCPNTYTVTVTDAWGCTATANTTVTEPTLLTASNTGPAQTSCNGVCDATVTAAGAGGTIGYTYSWNTVPVQNTAAANGLCAGSYTCTVTDGNSCTAITIATITEPTLVVIAPIANVTICNGGTTTLTAAASGGNPGGYTYLWTPAGTGATASVTVTPAATTVYTVTANDIANSCPSAPVNVTVTVNPPLAVVAAGTASVCPGASAVISATGSFGNGGPYTYTWAPAGTGTGSPVTVTPAATTTYTVTANDGCSPSVTATVTVTVLPSPVVAFAANNVSGCSPLCVTFTDNTTVAGSTVATWAWDFGDGSPVDITSAPNHCYFNANSYTVSLITTSTLGGCTSSASYNNYITVFPDPIANFTAPLSASIVNPVINFTDNSTGAATWDWNFGDNYDLTADSVSTLQNPVHTYTEEGTFCVTLSVRSINGCVSTYPLCVVIDPEFTFYIPNAFSPNGDGINDEFFGKGDKITSFEMSVYDRWGNLIFFSSDINKHWDGKANHGSETGELDVYVYSVKIKDFNGKKHKYIGTVTIVK